MIPCKECLVYALCRPKKKIKCSKLHDYASDAAMDYIKDDNDKRYWKHLRTLLPNICVITREGTIYYEYDGHHHTL